MSVFAYFKWLVFRQVPGIFVKLQHINRLIDFFSRYACRRNIASRQLDMSAICDRMHCLILSISELLYAMLLYKVWCLSLLANKSAILCGSVTPSTVAEAPDGLLDIFRTSVQKSRLRSPVIVSAKRCFTISSSSFLTRLIAW